MKEIIKNIVVLVSMSFFISILLYWIFTENSLVDSFYYHWEFIKTNFKIM